MTELEFLKDQEEDFKGSIKMHENCLKILNDKLAAVRKIIIQMNGQPDGALGRPADQSCER